MATSVWMKKYKNGTSGPVVYENLGSEERLGDAEYTAHQYNVACGFLHGQRFYGQGICWAGPKRLDPGIPKKER